MRSSRHEVSAGEAAERELFFGRLPHPKGDPVLRASIGKEKLHDPSGRRLGGEKRFWVAGLIDVGVGETVVLGEQVMQQGGAAPEDTEDE